MNIRDKALLDDGPATPFNNGSSKMVDLTDIFLNGMFSMVCT